MARGNGAGMPSFSAKVRQADVAAVVGFGSLCQLLLVM